MFHQATLDAKGIMRTLANGARQLVVHDALETMFIVAGSQIYPGWTPMTMVASTSAGPERR